MPAEPARTIAYIDGFNLYHGLCAKYDKRFLWLDVEALVRNLLPHHSTPSFVKFFTARMTEPEDRKDRQAIYLDALKTLALVQVFEGEYQKRTTECDSCTAPSVEWVEKMTDVKLATELLTDVLAGKCDRILLISGDSDHVPPIEHVRSNYPSVHITVAFPPRRKSNHLERLAHNSFVIGEGKLKKSQLPETVRRRQGGRLLTRPVTWH